MTTVPPISQIESRPSERRTSRARPLFEGIFLGGFECSCHRLESGRRLDLLASTEHDLWTAADYARLRQLKMSACRDGVPWARVERRRGEYDFSSAARMLHAAEAGSIQVIWDLMHFGWPDDLDVFSPLFPRRFSQFARAFALWFSRETDAVAMVTPINEMSFLAWAAGDVRCMFPFEAARGVELKVQLVRATIEAIEAIRDVLPNARFLQPEPLMNLVPAPEHPLTWRRVESDNLLQYQAWDMLGGRIWPSLGGARKYLDILGVNFYPDNQFTLDGTTIHRGDERYRPFSEMLLEASARYRRPMIVAETGCEGAERADWLHYVSDECARALQGDCELHGITLYPVINHPGWLDDRHCENGVWGYPDESGGRIAYEPLVDEIRAQTPRLLGERAQMLARRSAVHAR